jgi:hypothetical protein
MHLVAAEPFQLVGIERLALWDFRQWYEMVGLDIA